MSPTKPGDRRGAAIPAYAVIMAGGGSTRLWPLGRAHRPKQVLPLLGKKSLLQSTVDRLAPTFSRRRILVVTGAAHAAEVRRQLPRLARGNILVEPQPRNTAACVALAAEWLATRVGDALMVAVPSDHVVVDKVKERATIEAAMALAVAEQCLVTIGCVPTKPDTGFGYIECGARVRGASRSASWVKRFHEKPSAATARRYVASGKHLWNAGMFVGPANVFRRALAQHAPEVAQPLDGVWRSTRGCAARIRRAYGRMPALPIDIAVMQPLSTARAGVTRIAVVRAAFEWTDAGNWDAMAGLWPRDADGNSARGRLVAIDSRDSFVCSPNRLVALVGVSNLVVVDGGDVILVCARDRAQDVRKVSATLRQRGWGRYL